MSELEQLRRRVEALEGEVARQRQALTALRKVTAAALNGHSGQLQSYGGLLENVTGLVESMLEREAHTLERLDRVDPPRQE